MTLSGPDLVVFIAFLTAVIAISMWASRSERTSEDYFLAGRGLPWWLIGASLIASNISTEQFVGMSGSGFGRAGLAVASYEWLAAITLVVVARYLLPLYLRTGIFTMPEFLEYRYDGRTRTIMAVFMLAMYVGVTLSAVLYSGALGLRAMFDLDLTTGVWLIGLLAGAYTIYGGLKAVVWSDLLQGGALVLGGLVVAVLTLAEVGGVGAFLEANADRLHVVLPADHPDVPWTALVLGLWIPNFFYWGFNQFITQRTLAAKSLAEGQRGLVFAAAIKLIIPFFIVIPGIAAHQILGSDLANPDDAYPRLLSVILPAGLRGIMFAALFGAVMSTLDSMLNSASTIFTIDIYHRYLAPSASRERTIGVGRAATAGCTLIACLVAPLLDDPALGGIFRYIQMFQGFVSPGIVTAFAFGLLVRRAPARAAVAAMLGNLLVYPALLLLLPEVSFLNHMAITCGLLVGVMALITRMGPLPAPVELPRRTDLDLHSSPTALRAGAVVVLATLGLYVAFW